jgi:hypothetical protein
MTVLSDHVAADPNGRGYAADIAAGRPGHIVDKLNLKDLQANRTFIAIDMQLASILDLDVYRGVIGKMKAIAPNDIAVEDFLARLHGTGADMGHPKTLEMIDILAALPSGGFTADEASALKALSMQSVSEMDLLNLPPATEQMLRDEGVI